MPYAMKEPEWPQISCGDVKVEDPPIAGSQKEYDLKRLVKTIQRINDSALNWQFHPSADNSDAAVRKHYHDMHMQIMEEIRFFMCEYPEVIR